MAVVVYHPGYNFGLFGLERLHPFDARKYARAWSELRRTLGRRLTAAHRPVDRPATDAELALAHSAEYLTATRRPEVIAAATEIPLLKRVPGWLLRWGLTTPMRRAVRGTYLAAKAALDAGIAFNLGGGFHHAESSRGGGFCLFADAAVAIRQLRAEGALAPGRRVAYVDLDAHQGNGVTEQFADDRDVFVFDMYNAFAYPWTALRGGRERIDCDAPLRPNTSGAHYLKLLRDRLPGFLDSVSRPGPPLGIYNAGTDVVAGDPLGGLALSADDVLQRDLFTLREFRRRGIPVVMLTSGGYTRESYRLIAATIRAVLTDEPR